MNSTSLTPLEVAELLKITKNTDYELIKRGELPAYKVGRKLRIDKEDIDNYIKSQKSSTISSPDTQQQEITLNDKPTASDHNSLIVGSYCISFFLKTRYNNSHKYTDHSCYFSFSYRLFQAKIAKYRYINVTAGFQNRPHRQWNILVSIYC